jgi:hypothetical protein
MICHLLLFLIFFGYASAIAVGIFALSALCGWLDCKFGQWASWTLIGCVVIGFLAAAAWSVPCK